MKKINWTIFLVLSRLRSLRERFIWVDRGGGQVKRAVFKWDKTADCGNETKPPISKKRQNHRFCEGEQIAMNKSWLLSLIKASWPNHQNLAILVPNTIRKWDTTNLMQFPYLFATNNFWRMPTPKIFLKPSLPFNLNLWYPPLVFRVPNASEKFNFGSFLLIPPPPPTDLTPPPHHTP